MLKLYQNYLEIIHAVSVGWAIPDPWHPLKARAQIRVHLKRLLTAPESNLSTKTKTTSHPVGRPKQDVLETQQAVENKKRIECWPWVPHAFYEIVFPPKECAMSLKLRCLHSRNAPEE